MTRKIGCTGGIACGKTEATLRMAASGIPVLDTDTVAHEVMSPGNEVFEAVIHRFGKKILSETGTIQRSRLGEVVFNDAQALQDLNELVHPEVKRRWKRWLADRTEPVAVVAIPLLIEKGYQNEFDDIVCISSTHALMLKRLSSRGLSLSQAERRIQSQLPLEKKEQHATWILHNTNSLAEFHRKVDEWIQNVVHTETL